MVEKIQQFYKSVADARKKLSTQMKSQFSDIAKDYPSYEWKIKSIKMAKEAIIEIRPSVLIPRSVKLYDIVFEKKKRPNLKGHPFRGKD